MQKKREQLNMMRASGLLMVAVVLVTLSGCIPYTVGTTAQPAPPGELKPRLSVYTIPQGVALPGDSTTTGYMAFDMEGRIGLDEASDLGVRFPMMSGLVLSYKRRLTKSSRPRSMALAVMGDAGFVNLGNHAHLGATVLASGALTEYLTPYGGLRGMKVLPLNDTAVHDNPTLGGFAGLRIGSPDLGISPEVGLYYDDSALGLRSSEVIVVPAITLHGRGLLELISYLP